MEIIILKQRTCVRGDKHEEGVKLLEFIVEYNVTDLDKWVWIEASGKIEEMCKKFSAFNVPNRYVGIYLGKIPFTPIEGEGKGNSLNGRI